MNQKYGKTKKETSSHVWIGQKPREIISLNTESNIHLKFCEAKNFNQGWVFMKAFKVFKPYNVLLLAQNILMSSFSYKRSCCKHLCLLKYFLLVFNYKLPQKWKNMYDKFSNM